MQAMQIVVVALLFIGAVVSQFHPQAVLYPLTADGFDTVWLDDMSYVTELSVQSFPLPNGDTNLTYYVYGNGALRTVFPGDDFRVGSTPNEQFHFPFIDFQTIMDVDGSIWGFGPVGPLFYRDPNNTQMFDGVEYKVGMFSTKYFPNNPFGIFVTAVDMGFEGIFSSVRVAAFNPQSAYIYFAGFFAPDATNPQNINFGVYRVHLNATILRSGVVTSPPYSWNVATDVATLYPFAQLAPYNAEVKPILVHLWNVTGDPTSTTTYLVVIDPIFGSINLVNGDVDPTVPLSVHPIPHVVRFGTPVSAVAWKNFVFIGVAVPGNRTGRIEVIDVTAPTQLNHTTIVFPENGGYSNPRALVLDLFNTTPTLYVGFNGGGAIMRIDISKIASQAYAITGIQALPYYLHRVWVGSVAPQHVYFATNEQHSKVFRVSKSDFCPSTCSFFGYCKDSKCVCGEGFEMKDKECKYKELVREIEKEKRNKGGEVALGIFFAIAFVAAVAGWYMVYRNKRSAYQAV